MKKVQQQANNLSLTNTSTTIWKCVPCSKSFKTLESLNTHKNSKKHKKSEKDYTATHPDEPVSSLFKCSSYQNSTDSIAELQRELIEATQSDQPLSIEEDNKRSHFVKTTLESLRICLFCNKECKGVKKNLDHMRKHHNFIILDIECLINLKGLLAYIAERIQLGRLCLNCDIKRSQGS